jgi:hypothetical protein
MKISLKFSLKQKVYINPLKIDGRVLGVFISEKGESYNVRYFDGLKPIESYFIEEELSHESPPKELGFKHE